jgi:hypothetical protein
MSYRYARSNGQFLISKFKNSSIEETELKFRADESYDLLMRIVLLAIAKLQDMKERISLGPGGESLIRATQAYSW